IFDINAPASSKVEALGVLQASTIVDSGAPNCVGIHARHVFQAAPACFPQALPAQFGAETAVDFEAPVYAESEVGIQPHRHFEDSKAPVDNQTPSASKTSCKLAPPARLKPRPPSTPLPSASKTLCKPTLPVRPKPRPPSTSKPPLTPNPRPPSAPKSPLASKSLTESKSRPPSAPKPRPPSAPTPPSALKPPTRPIPRPPSTPKPPSTPDLRPPSTPKPPLTPKPRRPRTSHLCQNRHCHWLQRPHRRLRPRQGQSLDQRRLLSPSWLQPRERRHLRSPARHLTLIRRISEAVRSRKGDFGRVRRLAYLEKIALHLE
ncbi:unnamed protein product, partial [Ascophyllum nodosum]